MNIFADFDFFDLILVWCKGGFGGVWSVWRYIGIEVLFWMKVKDGRKVISWNVDRWGCLLFWYILWGGGGNNCAELSLGLWLSLPGKQTMSITKLMYIVNEQTTPSPCLKEANKAALHMLYEGQRGWKSFLGHFLCSFVSLRNSTAGWLALIALTMQCNASFTMSICFCYLNRLKEAGAARGCGRCFVEFCMVEGGEMFRRILHCMDEGTKSRCICWLNSAENTIGARRCLCLGFVRSAVVNYVPYCRLDGWWWLAGRRGWLAIILLLLRWMLYVTRR